MQLTRFADPAEFSARAEAYLLVDEAAHILPLGIAAAMIQGSDRHRPTPYFATVEDDGAVVAAALMTPPQNLVLARVAATGALSLLIDDLLGAGPPPPGVIGPAAESRAFAERWSARTGQPFRTLIALRIFRLDRVIPVAGVPGELRPLTAADRDLAISWAHSFNAEAEPNPSPDRARQIVDERFESPTGGLALWWDDGRPVAIVGYAGPTPNGIRVGPVYTPPEYRRRGYASAATAALTQRLLDGGRRCCFLTTDLTNPTSNHIYQAIGYRPVCDMDAYQFAP